MEYKQEYHENMVKSFEKIRADTNAIKENIKNLHNMVGAGFILMAVILLIAALI